jgi:uncharacterized membrane protein
MKDRRTSELREYLVGLFAFVISATCIVSVGFTCAGVSHPGSETPVAELLIPAITIFLFLTFVGAAIAHLACHATSAWLGLIAAIPYLFLALLTQPSRVGAAIGLGAASFTFVAYYTANRLRKTHEQSNVA